MLTPKPLDYATEPVDRQRFEMLALLVPFLMAVILMVVMALHAGYWLMGNSLSQ